MNRPPIISAIPPPPCQDAPNKINHHVPRIARRPPNQMRTNHFKKDRPKGSIKRNFTPRRRRIGRAQSQPALKPKEQRQRARHQQEIIEMKSQECIVDVRLKATAIQCVERTANQEQPVTKIPKLFHRRTKMAKPNAAATSSLKTRIMVTTLHHPSSSFQKFF